MKNLYSDPRWEAFRASVLARDGFTCVDCGTTAEGTRSMQAHHKQYLPNRFPWDYDLGDLETLCQGCHAETHGKTRPRTGWIVCSEQDLGAQDGKCDVGPHQMRYVFTIWHPNWPVALDVGGDCCDAMTGIKASRRTTFVESTRWKRSSTHAYQRFKGLNVEVVKNHAGYKLIIDGHQGKQTRASEADAMRLAFDVIESGLYAAWVHTNWPKKRAPEFRTMPLPGDYRANRTS